MIKIQTLLKTICPNDLVIYASNENIEYYIPKIPLTNLFYRCDKKFHIHDESMNDIEIGVIIVDCNIVEFYIFKNYVLKLIFKYSTDIGNKTRRGGQSAPRIGRMFENRKSAYIKKIKELIIEKFQTEYILLFTNKTLIHEFSNIDKIYKSIIIDTSIIDKKENVKIFIGEELNNIKIIYEKNKCKNIYEEFLKDSDSFIIGKDVCQSLEMNNVKYILKKTDEIDDYIQNLCTSYKVEIFIVDGITSEYYNTINHLGGIIAKKRVI